MKRLLVGPWLIVLLWLVWLGVDVLRARRLQDPGWIASRVDAVDAWKEGRREPITLLPDVPGSRRVWILGSSSVAAPSRDRFTRPLVRHLEASATPVVVDNHGWEGMPTWDEVTRFEDAWAAAAEQAIRPDVVVFYGEHNDITYTFHAALDLPHFDALTGLAWVFSGEAFRPHDAGATYWFYGHRRAPRLLRTLQEVGLLTLDPAAFQPLVEHALGTFRTNVDTIVASARAHGVPIVLVTPTGNYASEPFGPLQSTTNVWRAALAEPDPQRRLQGLMAARDAETFTSDMRMKSPLLDALRARHAPDQGVWVCDVEADWITRGVAFGGENFVDPVHFSEAGYDALTRSIAACLVTGPLAPQQAPPPSDP